MSRTLIFTTLLAIALTSLPALAQGERPQRPDRREQPRARLQDRSLRVGQSAPTFTLPSFDGESKTEVKEFRGKRPVIVFFGSYT